VFPLKDNIPTDRLPVVTLALIAINVLVYLVLQRPGSLLGDPDQQFIVDWGAIPYELTHPGDQCGILGSELVCDSETVQVTGPPTVLTAFSSMFLHGGLLHLGGNMLFLWIFGNNVEDSMGRVRFLAFYLLSGLAAIGLQVVVGPDEIVPTVGASGAVAGVLGGYILLYPRARVVTLIFIIFFFTIIELPATLILGFWFFQQIAFGALDLTNPTGGGGGVAYFAHIGGFLFGLAAIRLFASRVKDLPFGGAKYPVY
jgi:membrane associated rhomboid family serine protease